MSFPAKFPVAWRYPDSIQYMVPWAHPSPQPKRYLDRFSRLCTEDRILCAYVIMGPSFPLKLPLSMRYVNAHLIRGSLPQP